MTTTNKRYREFTVIFKDPDSNGFSHPNNYLEFIKNSENIKSLLKYLIFQWEAESNQFSEDSLQKNLWNNSETFYRMYFEFNNNISDKKIKSEFFNNLDVTINPRLESQEEAIRNCSDQSKSLVINGFFELGEPKKIYHKNYSPTNHENKKIPLNHKEQIIHIIEETKSGKYNSLKDIEKDYPYLSYSKKIVLQDIINRNNPFDSFEVDQAKVIWVYGKSGSGKTFWTNNYLRENGYNGTMITRISPLSLNSYGAVWFKLHDENRKVLVINEVDRTFPKQNNLIAWIDKGDLLPVKNGEIRNNYELIIVNSIYSPEEIVGFLGKAVAKQSLRRIFNYETDSKVYKITANEEQLKKAKELKLKKTEFIKFYKPIVELIPEPDYSLMKD